MKLSTLMKAWDVIHEDDTGGIGFDDLVELFEYEHDGWYLGGVENDIKQDDNE